MRTEPVDLSVIVTAHSETVVSGPTMRAADIAVAEAEAAGFTVERLVALDNATAATQAFFGQPALDHWRKLDLDGGDLGRTRNAVLPLSAGRAIAFLDADDLFSRNWLAEGMKRLAEAGPRAIIHPELNWLFDGARSVYQKIEQDDPFFTPYHFYFMNYYDSLCLAPREAHEEIPYVNRDIPRGLSFQDWQFAIETMAAGWRHVHAPDTIIFKRRRDTSLVTESRTRSALVRSIEPMAIDRVAQLAKAAEGAKPAPGAQERPAPQASEPPHHGAGFEARVARAKALHRDQGEPDLYKAVRRHFDHSYYLSANPDIAALEEVDPVGHFLRAGAEEGRNPSPTFGLRAYADRLVAAGTNPVPEGAELYRHWIEVGRARGISGVPFRGFSGVCAALGRDPAGVERDWLARFNALRARLVHGELGHQARLCAEIEPIIELSWPAAHEVKIPPFQDSMTVTRTAAIHDLHKQAGFRRARAVITVNRARFGGARRIEGHLAHALAELSGPDEVVLITTEDGGALPPGRLPEGVRVLDMSSWAARLPAKQRQRLLVELIRSLKAEVVFNVNSRTLWDALVPYGDALAASCRIVPCLLCEERSALGHRTGYPLTRFYRHFDQAGAVCTDSHYLAEKLRSAFLVPPEQADKLIVLPGPVDATIPLAPAPRPSARPQVFWAGRLDPQKRPDLLFDIARLVPGAQFRVWGAEVMGSGTDAFGRIPGNVTLEGRYDAFTDLPLQEAAVFLYTSGWDGVPQILLEAAMAGLPIVGTAVGGTPEVLDASLSFPVPETAGPESYATRLGQVFADPDQARKQALTLRERLVSDRTAGAYRDLVARAAGWQAAG